MRTLRTKLAVVLVFVVAALAMAMPALGPVFEKTYKLPKTSELAKAKCGACHVSAKGGKLNPYGVDMQKVMKAAKTKKLTPELLKKIETLDSDKDGVKNIDEIKKDKLPGVKGK